MKPTHLKLVLVLSLAQTLACTRHEEHAGAHETHASPATPGSDEHQGHEGHTGHEGHMAMPAARPAGDTSLYQLTSQFTDQSDQPFTFSSLTGHPTLVLMFYGSCETICPTLLEDVRAIDNAVAADKRAGLRVLLVTFDPERDTAQRLTAMAAEKHFDLTRWSLLRGSESSIRELSMVLGVQYRRLPDGNFSHSALITLLDPQGAIAGSVEGLHGDSATVLSRIAAFP